jgi:hypothetical protein
VVFQVDDKFGVPALEVRDDRLQGGEIRMNQALLFGREARILKLRGM